MYRKIVSMQINKEVLRNITDRIDDINKTVINVMYL